MESFRRAISGGLRPSADEKIDNPTTAEPSQEKRKKASPISSIVVIEHTDIIKNEFWEGKPWLLSS